MSSISLGHASRLTPAQTLEHPVEIFTLQNEAYPDFDKARDWLILFPPNSRSPKLNV